MLLTTVKGLLQRVIAIRFLLYPNRAHRGEDGPADLPARGGCNQSLAQQFIVLPLEPIAVLTVFDGVLEVFNYHPFQDPITTFAGAIVINYLIRFL